MVLRDGDRPTFASQTGDVGPNSDRPLQTSVAGEGSPRVPFNSLTFCVFFVAVYCVYLALTRRYRWQNVFLLAASYVFYGWWDWRFLSLIAVSTAVDYFVARSIESAQGGSAGGLRKRRLLLLVSIVTNLSILAFFKYFNFFADSATSLLSVLGFAPDRVTLEIILPIGISFYTFQSLSIFIKH